jgi:hypothetical protein
MQILQINFKYNMPVQSYLALTTASAEAIAQVEGCLWKIWLLKEDAQEAGGVYLFESAQAAQAYLASPIVEGLAQHPGISDVSVRLSGYVEEPTRITRGPVFHSLPSGLTL